MTYYTEPTKHIFDAELRLADYMAGIDPPLKVKRNHRGLLELRAFCYRRMYNFQWQVNLADLQAYSAMIRGKQCCR